MTESRAATAATAVLETTRASLQQQHQSLPQDHAVKVHPENHNNNNNSATLSPPRSPVTTTSTTSSSLHRLVQHHSQHALHLPPPPHSVLKPCRMGLLLWHTDALQTTSTIDLEAIRVMDHSISFCQWAALCVWTATDETAVREWLRRVEETTPGYGNHDAAATPIYVGPDGAAQMLADPSIHAVYVMIPPDDENNNHNTKHDTTQQQSPQAAIVLQCLQARKHVLIKDWHSTALSEFRIQVATARENHCFVQFATMFDIQYNVQAFLDTIKNAPHFGNIIRIQAELHVGPEDWPRVGVRTDAPGPTDSCIVRLARFCLLMGLLLTPNDDNHDKKTSSSSCSPAQPQMAQITSLCRDATTGVPLHATAKVWFVHPARCMELRVGYSSVRTRQWFQVSSAHKYAVLTEFALPSTHGLHSFRVYDTGDDEIRPDTPDKTCWEHMIKAGETLDVPCRLPPHVMMWRRFAELCQSVDQQQQQQQTSSSSSSSNDGGGWSDEAIFLTRTAMALKATLLALETSAAAGARSSNNGNGNTPPDYPAVPVQWEL